MAEICVKHSEITLKKHFLKWGLEKLINLSIYLGYYLTSHETILWINLQEGHLWLSEYLNYYENNLAHLTGAEIF